MKARAFLGLQRDAKLNDLLEAFSTRNEVVTSDKVPHSDSIDFVDGGQRKCQYSKHAFAIGL